MRKFLGLIGNPEYTHVLQDPIQELREFFSIIKEKLEEPPDAIVVLADWLKYTLELLVPGIPVYHFHVTRKRDILENLKVVGLPITKGEPVEEIKEKLVGKGKIWIVDTIAFSGNTLRRTIDALSLYRKKVSLFVMGITPTAEEKAEGFGIPYSYTFLIGGEIEDLWHIDDFFVPTPTKKGDIPPEELLEILIPYLKGERTLKEIIEEYGIPRKLLNPNLLLNCGEDGYVGSHYLGRRIVENYGEIKELLREGRELLLPSYNKDALKEILEARR